MIQLKVIKENQTEDLETSVNKFLKEMSVGTNLKDVKFVYDENYYVALILLEKTKAWESNSD